MVWLSLFYLILSHPNNQIIKINYQISVIAWFQGCDAIYRKYQRASRKRAGRVSDFLSSCPRFLSASPIPVVISDMHWPSGCTWPWSGANQLLQASSMSAQTLEAKSVLRLCSGRTQYSDQSPQRTAGGRNTTPLSHLADVPVLLFSLPHFFPPSPPSLILSGSISNSCPVRMGSVAVCVCAADERQFIVSQCQAGARGVRRSKTKINTEEGEAKGRVRDGEKLGPASEYNQFSYETLFTLALPQQPTSILFSCEGAAGNEASHTAPWYYRPLSAWIHHWITGDISKFVTP